MNTFISDAIDDRPVHTAGFHLLSDAFGRRVGMSVHTVSWKQAQLSQRNRTMLRVIEYSAKSNLAIDVMFSTCPSTCPSICLLPTSKHYILKMNELISIQTGTSLPRAVAWRVKLRCQEVEGQGHRRLKSLEAWRRHHSRSLESSR